MKQTYAQRKLNIIQNLVDALGGKIIDKVIKNDDLVSVKAKILGKEIEFMNMSFDSIPFGLTIKKIREMIAAIADEFNLIVSQNDEINIKIPNMGMYKLFQSECLNNANPDIYISDILGEDKPSYTIDDTDLLNHMKNHIKNKYSILYELKHTNGKTYTYKFTLYDTKCNINVSSSLIGNDIYQTIIYEGDINKHISKIENNLLLDEYKDEFKEKVKKNKDELTINYLNSIFLNLKFKENSKIDKYLKENYKDKAIKELNELYKRNIRS